jgi:hypothetical protein
VFFLSASLPEVSSTCMAAIRRRREAGSTADGTHDLGAVTTVLVIGRLGGRAGSFALVGGVVCVGASEDTQIESARVRRTSGLRAHVRQRWHRRCTQARRGSPDR